MTREKRIWGIRGLFGESCLCAVSYLPLKGKDRWGFPFISTEKEVP